jgi:hypothetical protein
MKITVSLPSGWEKVQGSVLEHQYLKNGASFMIKEEFALNGKALDDAVKEAKQQIGKYFKTVEFANDEQVKVNGHDAQSIAFTYSIAMRQTEMMMKMNSIYLIIKGKCYNISFGSTADHFMDISSDIPQILQGIKFIY